MTLSENIKYHVFYSVANTQCQYLVTLVKSSSDDLGERSFSDYHHRNLNSITYFEYNIRIFNETYLCKLEKIMPFLRNVQKIYKKYYSS